MREILFKAKRIDNGEWVEGGYSYCKKDDTHFITQMSKDHISYISRHQQVDPNTISQWTGLVDKNGNKICENDIIVVNERYKGKVVWSEVWTHYMVIGEENVVIAIHKRWDDVYEVIGNIFDNPELIER